MVTTSIQKKTCANCKTEKSLTEFYPNGYGGLRGRCKPCTSEQTREWGNRMGKEVMAAYARNRRARNRVAYREYDKIAKRKRRQIAKQSFWEAQDGLCAICKKPLKDGRFVHLDHDHSCCPGIRPCGQCFRGLLCAGCNTVLRIIEDPQKRQAAIEYVDGFRQRSAMSASTGSGA